MLLLEFGFVFWEEIVRWEEGQVGGGWRERGEGGREKMVLGPTLMMMWKNNKTRGCHVSGKGDIAPKYKLQGLNCSYKNFQGGNALMGKLPG